MEEAIIRNHIILRGLPVHAPQFSHSSRGERFFTFPLEVCRLSGAVDTVNILSREELVDALEPNGCSKLCVSGEVRSFNNKSGDGPRLVITVFAKGLSFEDGDDENNVTLRGVICKQPNLRTTPMGREICDLMLAVNRRYGRSDYLPCIAWGAKAREACLWSVGDEISITGRLQSRKYTKNIDGEPIEKTAFEISVVDAALTDSDAT